MVRSLPVRVVAEPAGYWAETGTVESLLVVGFFIPLIGVVVRVQLVRVIVHCVIVRVVVGVHAVAAVVIRGSAHDFLLVLPAELPVTRSFAGVTCDVSSKVWNEA